MRAIMTMAAVGLALAWSATTAWSEPARLKSEPKSLATVKANNVNALSSSLSSTLNVAGARQAKAMKDSAANRTLKSGAQDNSAGTDMTLDPHRSGLANRKGSTSQLAGVAAKSGQLQAFAAASLANAGLRASSPTLKANEIKEQGNVNKLR
jgi:hypothetical protein